MKRENTQRCDVSAQMYKGRHVSDVDHVKENILLAGKGKGGKEHLGKKEVILSFHPPFGLYLILVLKYVKYNVCNIFQIYFPLTFNLFSCSSAIKNFNHSMVATLKGTLVSGISGVSSIR